jgi:MFS family permease
MAPVRDRTLIYTSAFLRALATGMIGVLLGIYIAKLGFSGAVIGAVIGVGLGGCALAALLTTIRGDRWGRRRVLVGLALLGAIGTAAFAFASAPVALGAAAALGMLNGMGRDRGAALILEQSILPATIEGANRTRAFAWYNVLQDVGHALGGLMAGVPALLRSAFAFGEIPSFRAALGLYGLIILATGLIALRLSPAVEAARAAGGDGSRAASPRAHVSPESRRVVWRISSLFALDSLGGGFLTTAILTLFFYQRFGVGEAVVGPLFFAARLLNAVSHLAAAWLAARIGLVNTMVFTHMPSSVLLATVAIAPSFPVAALLFLLREGLVEMDVPTRQSYVMAVVRPEERTFAAGVTHLVRLGAWAIAPAFAGLFMSGVSLAAPLVAGAGMKLLYDALLYAAFRRVKPPEEIRPSEPSPAGAGTSRTGR